MPRTQLLLLSALCCLTPLASADTLTLAAQKDTTLYAESGSLSNGAGPVIFSGTNNFGQVRRALIQFNIAGNIPSGSTITSVRLTLAMEQTMAVGETIELRRVLQNWGEAGSVAPFGGGSGTTALTGDATWSSAVFPATAWTTSGGTFSATVSATLPVDQIASYTWGSTAALVADVQSFLDNAGTNFGWLLLNTNEVASPTAKRFASRESTVASSRPSLVVNFTPPAPFAPFCPGDGTGTACPCANSGATGRGCANSSSASGALLQVTGVASLANDSLVLTGAGMPNALAVFFQGSTQQAAGAGVVFGDGLWCAGGTTVRLTTKTNAAGASVFPGVGEARVSAQGGVSVPGVRHYQVWYEDTASFCSASTFSFSNAVSVTWN